MEQSNLNYQHHHQSDNKPIGIDHPINQPSSSNETSISTSLAVLHHPLIESTPNSTSSSSPSSNSKPAHVRRPNWTTTEDEQLCRSWLENSLDPVKNTIQKGTQFWHRVAQDFTNRGPGHIERNKDHVRNR
ncbi:hypothetical protein BY996DRAFT_6637923 [Phakopsora pachyrhizi]|uniref:Expressed protein n=1 Tax=Phakopsora pachyrhizi TaxID=170000 RepID=A0AAV0ANJ3_PHAPC|nr:hypothetical protein BY996DRAFT_6637923 [Phakopsora pachyrhizi]CAH7670568.1 expressed protein [Phakopsora pachyrhizi]